MNPIANYFNGEKTESYIFILIGAITFIMALIFMFILKTAFWRGAAIPFVIVALLELIVGYTIVKRSPKDIMRVETFIKKESQNIKALEIPRMEKVMHNFIIYRYVEIALIIIGIALMYTSFNNPFWKGIGIGLFIQASTVLTLDFFAERRGHIYLNYLNEFVKKHESNNSTS